MTRPLDTRFDSAPRGNLLGGGSRIALALAVSGSLALTAGSPAQAGPSGGQVASGNASISTAGNHTQIVQGSRRVVIDWESFDIDPQESVRFDQPGSGSIALNRVLSEVPTHIRGALEANGNVWIVNGNGVVIHRGATVDVGGLLATTADIDNADFMAGRYDFDRPGAEGATVENRGRVTFGDAGLAAFVAPNARNQGVIAGKMGTVVIAGEEVFTVDLAGDGLFAFEFGGAAGGQAVADGSISNDGGYILITARGAADIIDRAVSVGGVVAADTVQERDGRIVLSAGGGQASVSGTVRATGDDAGERGGTVEVTGGSVELTGTARVDASGEAGGGRALVGGDVQGGGTLAPAGRTTMRAGAVVAADATGSGNGGTAVLWSEQATAFDGTISARGGARGGDGGFIEVSSRGTVDVRGTMDTRAPVGATGRALIDPEDIIIRSGVPTFSENRVEEGESRPSSVDPTYIATTTMTTGLTLQADRNITVAEGVTANGDLTLDAGNDIAVDARIDAPDSRLTLNADADGSGQGTVVFGRGAIAAGDVSIDAGEAVSLGSITADTLSVTTKGSITGGADGALDIGGRTDLRAEGTVFVEGRENDFVGPVNTSSPGNVTLTDTNDIILGEVTAGGNLSVRAAGNITDQGRVRAAGDTTLLAGANIALDTSTNNFVGTVDSRAAGSVTLRDRDTIALTRTVAGTDLAVRAGADLTATGPVRVTGNAGLISGGVTTLASVAVDGNLTSNAGGDISATGPVSVGGNAGLTSGGTTTLDTVSVTGGLTVDSVGDIGGGGPVRVTGLTDLTSGGNIALEGARNDFSTVTAQAAAGSIALRDDNDVELTAVQAATDLTVNADDAITATGPVSVGGNAGLTSGGTTTLVSVSVDGNLTSDAGSDIVATGPVTVGLNAGLTSVGATTLETVSVTGALTSGAGGDITASGPVTVGGDAGLTSGGTTTLVSVSVDGDLTSDAGGNIVATGPVTVGRNADLTSVGATTLETVTVTGALTVDAGGDINGGGPVIVTGATDLMAGGSIDLQGAQNDFFTVAAQADTGSIALNDDNDIELTTVQAATDLTASADDSITATGPVTVGGNAGLTSGGATTLQTVSVTGALTSRAGGDIVATGPVIVGGDTGLTSGGATTLASVTVGGDLTSRGTGNIMATGPVDVTGNAALRTGGAATLDTVTVMGGLTVNAAGDIDGGGPVIVTGGTGLVSGGNIDLQGAQNDFSTVAARADSGSIALNDDNDITLAGVRSQTDLTVSADDAITATGPVTVGRDAGLTSGGATTLQTVSVTGTLTSRAGGDIVATGPVTVGGDAGLTSGGATTLERVGVTGNLTSRAAGDIVATGPATVGGNARLTSGGATTLDTVTVTGGLNVNATGNIDGGGPVIVMGTTGLVSGGNIDLQGAQNDFSTVAARANTGSIALNDDNDITLAGVRSGVDLTVGADDTITATGPVTVGRDAGLTSGGTTILRTVRVRGALTSVAGGDIAAAGPVRVTGNADLTSANDTALASVTVGGTLTSRALGNIAATGPVSVTGNANLTSDGDTSLDTVTVGDNLTVAADAAITATGPVRVANDADLTSGTATTLASVRVGGVLTSRAGGDITATGPVTVIGNADLTSGGATTLASVRVGSDLTATSEGSITDDGPVFVGGTTTLTSNTGDIALDTATNDFKGQVNADGGDVTFQDANAILLGTVTAGGDLTVTAENSITDDATVTVTGTTTLTSNRGNVDLDTATNDFTGQVNADGTNVTLQDASAILLGTVTAGNNLTVTAEDGITDDGPVTVTRTTTLTSNGDDIALDTAANDFMGQVNADGRDVTLVDANAIVLGTVTAGADLAVTAEDGITDVRTVTVTGTTTLTSNGDDILLNTAANDFMGQVNADGRDVTLVDASAIALGTVTAGRDLAVTAGGDLTATGPVTVTRDTDLTSGGATTLALVTAGNDLTVTSANGITDTGTVTVGGVTDLTSNTGDIVLDTATNDFTGRVDADGGNVTLEDASAISLGTITATNDLSVTAGGSITDTGTLTVGGTTTLNSDGGDIDLDSEENDFMSQVDAEGEDVRLVDANAIQLGNIVTSKSGSDDATIRTFDGTLATEGDLTVQAMGGGISQASGTSIVTEGRALFRSVAGEQVILTNAGNDFGRAGTDGAVFVDTADGVSIADRDALEIGGIHNVTGPVRLMAEAGSLTLRDMDGAGDSFDDAGAYRIASNGTWSLDARGDVRIDDEVDAVTSNANLVIAARGDGLRDGKDDGDVEFRGILGGDEALDEVRITEARDVTFGLDEDGDRLVNGNRDIFFVDRLTMRNVDGDISLALGSGRESVFDASSDYFGLNIGEPLGLDYTGSTPSSINLFGFIGTSRRPVAALAPVGPTAGDFEFNNCIIGDTSCALTGSPSVPLDVEVEPDTIFTPFEARADDLFVSFGNEELWTLPAVFSRDLSLPVPLAPVADEEEDNSEDTQ